MLNPTFALILISLVVVVVLLFVGYWVLSQFFLTTDQKTHTAQKTPNNSRTKQNLPIQRASKNSKRVTEEYPDALLMDTQTIVNEYKAGRRDFQNVYPTAVRPYETFLKWTVLDKADFSRAMFYRVPFDGTSLIETNFNGAYLEGASFRGAVLKMANFTWADLTSADLSGADLTQANLSHATLQDADLSNATLKDTIVTNEQLENARSLKGAIMPDGTRHQ